MTATPSIDLPAQQRILQALEQELAKPARQLAAAIALMDEGATVPFIARYRKEATGGLDDTVLRELEVRLAYLRELEERRAMVIDSIRGQGKLTPELEVLLQTAQSKQRIEDLYAPFKPKRRTRAQIAREAGLEALAEEILTTAGIDPLQAAQRYIRPDAGFADAKACLDGARDILAERNAENADLLTTLRTRLKSAWIYSKIIDGKQAEGANFQDWFDYREPVAEVPSHRALALLRGRSQGILDLKIALSEALEAETPHPCVKQVYELCYGPLPSAIDHLDSRHRWLLEVARWSWRVRLLPAFETELINTMRESAEAEAIRVFARNLRNLLLAAPAGAHAVLGLDPGVRTGVKVAAIDTLGKLVETATIYPHEPRRDWEGSLQTLAQLCRRREIRLVAIGNGTASRETERLVIDLMKRCPELQLTRVTVSEAGASVYSASELAAQEFPDLDVSLRGAVSIARRLQDPLAELVKIDPKSIGVGQYQHDVDQRALARSLDAVVEDCVNAVGVDLNRASAPLLARVAGFTQTLARNVVLWREQNGAFATRSDLLKVPRLGDRTFEQAAGFLRIPDGVEPLDASAVHPEAYPLVQNMLAQLQKSAGEVMQDPKVLQGLRPERFVTERFGLPTIRDILSELEKPGRDPRGEFRSVEFRDDVQTINDLHAGMVLEGVVTNVANFGAFVDLGVHQDGLVHVSALSHRFVKDPHELVKVGQAVTVKVMEVDVMRKRIGLSMRLDDEPGMSRGSSAGGHLGSTGHAGQRGGRPSTRDETSKSGRSQKAQGSSAMAEAFARLKQRD